MLVWIFLELPAFARAQVGNVAVTTTSDFGGVGLMQMPTARFGPEGEFSLASSRVSPYLRTSLTMQPIPQVESVLRYTSIQNRPYGATDEFGGQSYKDKALDLKIRLAAETSAFPEIALGFRDLGGTGFFSGEYLVATRRYYDFDFSIGMGWGSLGSRGQIPNPFARISSRFKNRSNDSGLGGTLSVPYFHGDRASVFGGINYRTPIPGLTLKLELDGNDYQSEPKNNNQTVSSPFNLGVVYSYGDWLDLSLGVERGNTLMVQFALHGNLHTSSGLPKFDPPPEKIKARDASAGLADPTRIQNTSSTQKDDAWRITQALETHNYQVDSVRITDKRAEVVASQKRFRATPKAIGRAARIMANNVDSNVEEFSFVSLESGLEANRVTLLRKDLEKAQANEGSPEEIGANALFAGPRPTEPNNSYVNPNRYPSFNWSWSPAMRHHIGGPDNPYFYQLFLRLDGELQFTKGLSATGSLAFDINNNFEGLKLASDSQLPHVRSDIKEYLKQGKNGVNRLELDYLTNLSENWYGRVSGGLLEEMFGGVSTEVLYKPYGQDWAIGAEINEVRQRNYDQRFSFRDYRVTTGHMDYYYQLPYYNLLAQISVGRYLAGDVGATFDISRRFDSGAVFGAFVTKTNVSAAQFGEGSFDKGFYISVPMDFFSLFSSRGSVGIGWRPLTRDGGQRLNVGKRLYPTLRDSGPDALKRDWGQLLD